MEMNAARLKNICTPGNNVRARCSNGAAEIYNHRSGDNHVTLKRSTRRRNRGSLGQSGTVQPLPCVKNYIFCQP